MMPSEWYYVILEGVRIEETLDRFSCPQIAEIAKKKWEKKQPGYFYRIDTQPAADWSM